MIDILLTIKDILSDHYATPIFHALLGGVAGAMITVAGLILYFILWNHRQGAPTTITAELSPQARNELLSLTNDLKTISGDVVRMQNVLAEMSMVMATAKQDMTEIAERVSSVSVGMDTAKNLRDEIDQLTRDNIMLNKKLRKRRASE